jgi:predicted transcriptional regulator
MYDMEKEAIITFRIEKTKLTKLQRIAKKKDRAVSWLVRQAIDRLIQEESGAGKDQLQGSKDSSPK